MYRDFGYTRVKIWKVFMQAKLFGYTGAKVTNYISFKHNYISCYQCFMQRVKIFILERDYLYIIGRITCHPMCLIILQLPCTRMHEQQLCDRVWYPFIREFRYHSLNRVGTHSSTHQKTFRITILLTRLMKTL